MLDHTEFLSGGLNNAVQPMLLEPGELTLCSDAVYSYKDDLLYHAPLQLKLGYVDTTNKYPLTGLGAAVFQNGTTKLLAMINSAYADKLWSATLGTFADPYTALTWSDITPSGWASSSTLQLANYTNKYYIFTGAGTRNWVYKQDGTFRAHGMIPVTEAPGVITVTSTWPLGADAVPFFYEYWVTELIKSGDTVELESTATLDGVASIYVDAATKGVQVSRPLNSSGASFNSSATHWRVYRSVSKELLTDQAFPNGELISSDIPIATSNFLDGSSSSVGLNSATIVVSSSGVTNPNNLVAAGNATFAATANAVLRGFGLSAVTNPIAGIEVKVNYGSAPGTVTGGVGKVSISPDGGSTWPAVKTISFDATSTGITWGGATDLWNYTGWSAADFSDTLFYVKIESVSLPFTYTIDSVQAKVYYLGGAASSNTPFPSITITVGGSQVLVGEDGQPPLASCGAIFADSLVTNDIANPQRVCWSIPGKPESFPAPYYIDVSTPSNDEVTAIIPLGNRCIIGMTNSVWRLNYLPTEDDIRFQRGPALDVIDPNNGIAGPLACCEYTNATGHHEIAYIGIKGLRTTDGYTSKPLNNTLDWHRYLYGSGISGTLFETLLLNNTANEELILVIPRAGVLSTLGGEFSITTNQPHTQMHFPYNVRHLRKDGTLKVTGPITGSYKQSSNTTNVSYVSCGTVVKNYEIANGNSSVVLMGWGGGLDAISPTAGYGYQGGVTWYAPWESYGANATYQTEGEMQIQTRVMFANDIQGEWRIKEVYMGPVVTEDGTLTLYSYNHGATSSPSATASKSITGDDSLLYKKVIFDRRAQGHQLKWVTSDTLADGQGKIGFFKILAEDFSKEDR